MTAGLRRSFALVAGVRPATPFGESLPPTPTVSAEAAVIHEALETSSLLAQLMLGLNVEEQTGPTGGTAGTLRILSQRQQKTRKRRPC